MWNGSALSVWLLKVVTILDSGDRISFFLGLGKGMCLGGMIPSRRDRSLGRYVTGSRLVISDEIGSLGIRRAADLYNLCKVVVMGGTYVRSWSASSGESQKAPAICRRALCCTFSSSRVSVLFGLAGLNQSCDP